MMMMEDSEIHRRRDSAAEDHQEEDEHDHMSDGEDEGDKSKRNKAEEKKENPHRGVLKFRSYVPRDTLLKELKMDTPPLPSMIDEINKKLMKIDSQEALDITPKKPNWDLKRDIEKKLEVLERRTQRGIVQLLRQKLEQEEKKAITAGGSDEMDE